MSSTKDVEAAGGHAVSATGDIPSTEVSDSCAVNLSIYDRCAASTPEFTAYRLRQKVLVLILHGLCTVVVRETER